MSLEITLLDAEIHSESQTFISVLSFQRSSRWCLFYFEKNPAHAGGEILWLVILGIRLI